MNCLLNLPDQIVTVLLLEWLDMNDVGRLDSSVCQVDLRPQFLQAVLATPKAFPPQFARCQRAFRSEYDRKLHYEKVLVKLGDWACLRNVGITELAVTGKLCSSDQYRKKLLSHMGAHVKRVIFNAFDSKTYDQVMNDISTLCPAIEEIEFMNSPSLRTNEVPQGRTWNKLKTITIYFETNGLYLKAFARCNALITLDVSSLVNTNALTAFIKLHGATLQQILESIDGPLRSVYKAIAKKCPRLVSLRTRFRADAVPHLQNVLMRCQQLQDLDLYCVSDESAAVFAQSAGARLTNLSMRSFNMSTSELTLVTILESCPNLNKLSLIRIHIASNALFLRSIPQFCPQLMELNLVGATAYTLEGTAVPGFHVTDADLCALGTGMSTFERLDLKASMAITDVGFLALLQHNRQLKSLTFQGRSLQISEAALLQVPQLCPELELLRLGEKMSSPMTLRAAEAIVQGCGKLVRIAIDGALQPECFRRMMAGTLKIPRNRIEWWR